MLIIFYTIIPSHPSYALKVAVTSNSIGLIARSKRDYPLTFLFFFIMHHVLHIVHFIIIKLLTEEMYKGICG